MNITLGLLAHVDAGKTTFAEGLLFHTGSIRRAGRVDHRDTFLDTHQIERARGITVFSKEAFFKLENKSFFLLDTPGHRDFVSETERSVRVLDFAVLIISCAEGIQSHTETLWRLLEKHSVPTIIFLNKNDREGADPSRVFERIKKKFSGDAVLMDGCGDISENQELMEELAQRDEALLEMYFSGGCNEAELFKRLQVMIRERRLFPCFTGSALQRKGFDNVIFALENFVQNEASDSGLDDKPFAGEVYKVRYDSKGTKMTYIKVNSGKLRVKEELTAGEKINSISICHGEKQIPVQEGKAGGVYCVTGISGLCCGDRIEGAKVKKLEYQFVPVLSCGLEFDTSKCSYKTMLEYMKLLELEEPTLMTQWDENTKQISVRVMGEIQLEVLKVIIKERFNTEADFGPCKILYLETIKSPVTGRGHFEPLRHYAEVHLRLIPADRGSGLSFSSQCPLETLENSFQNLVKTHIFEKVHRGALTGSPITDIQFVLLTGKTHLKHTEGGDFREAVYRAIRQGLRKAEKVLLEPWYTFEIESDSAFVGRILSDIQRMYGSFQPPEIEETRAVIKGEAPAESFRGYPSQLAAFTSGKASVNIGFGGYRECHNTEEVVEKIGYNADRDTANTADSVFCSHGAGYTVKWDEADGYMHCFSQD